MMCPSPFLLADRARGGEGLGRRWLVHARLLLVGLAWALLLLAGPSIRAAEAAEALPSFELAHTDDGVYLDFVTNFELNPVIEEALQKGVALNFVVEAQVFRERWYWRDQRVARATRMWRLSYQPLTRQYRVSLGGLNQVFDALPDALASMQHVSRWKVAEAADVAPAGKYHLQFTYQLDTSLLPRPMQIGIGGQSDWLLLIQRTQRLPARTAPAPATSASAAAAVADEASAK